ncbi:MULTISPECIES: hypothetical protein [Streptomyces]|uniref:hypothetical protein n=1 Tax=Streptomyces TaxID=1883 RepID=UPI0016759F57|nr:MULTISPECIES: hypothetical protein [Streptomyces]MBK3520840.1 hypothetical protein [Streptomyces sp. MBT70]GGR66930.1 hypothetical protein GCM10010236_21060 [Streptomyces eurythermus]
MAIVACLLLPVVGLLLYGMDRVEDWLTRPPRPPRHGAARHGAARHLRLIRGGGQAAGTRARTARRSADAA